MTHITNPEIKKIPYADLLLDPRNPRLAGHVLDLGEQDAILHWLWREKAVDEIVSSMLASGYWEHEELFATKEEEDHLVVVEGNRRLAAVKLILEPALRERLKIQGIAEPRPDIRKTMTTLPVIVKSRADIWDYIGFKHVHGAQAWDSIAKAEYVFRVHTEMRIGLERIAETIGDKHDTVTRLYRSYLVLDQAKRDTGFAPDDAQQVRFPFSHLWTALGYQNVQRFLGVDNESLLQRSPVPKERTENLRLLMLWLFGSRREEMQPLVQRQNPDLRTLATALGSEKSLALIKRGLPLSTAYEAAVGDRALFAESLVGAEESLRQASRFVATGYTGSKELLSTADNILLLAKHLQRTMSEQAAGKTLSDE